MYFIMPFRAGQYSNQISLAFFVNHNILWLRAVGFLLVISPILYYLRKGRWWQKSIVALALVLYGVVVYVCNVQLVAANMFGGMKEKVFAGSAADTTNRYRDIIGVVINGQAKAYPIALIGYHHQLTDTVGGTPILITYCTLCHTGCVYRPVINGRQTTFLLMGVYHFNAVFQDNQTKSWWQQSTGKAIAGKLKGAYLPRINSSQTSLHSWLLLYPNSLILQPDKNYKQEYADFANGGTVF